MGEENKVDIGSVGESSTRVEGKKKRSAQKVLNKIVESNVLESNAEASDVIAKMMEKAGITDDVLGRVLAEGLKSEMTVKLNAQGATLDVADFSSRHKYLLVALELKKYLKDKAVLIQNGIFNDPKIQEDADRILKLRKGMNV